jgi:hypothetical protein
MVLTALVSRHRDDVSLVRQRQLHLGHVALQDQSAVEVDPAPWHHRQRSFRVSEIRLLMSLRLRTRRISIIFLAVTFCGPACDSDLDTCHAQAMATASVREQCSATRTPSAAAVMHFRHRSGGPPDNVAVRGLLVTESARRLRQDGPTRRARPVGSCGTG